MLLEPLVVQHFQHQWFFNLVRTTCSKHTVVRTIWFYNIYKNNVSRTVGFTTLLSIMFLKLLVLQLFQKQLLKYLTVDIFKHNVAETNDSSNIVFANFVESLVLTTFRRRKRRRERRKPMLLKPLILQHFQTQCCYNHWVLRHFQTQCC